MPSRNEKRAAVARSRPASSPRRDRDPRARGARDQRQRLAQPTATPRRQPTSLQRLAGGRGGARARSATHITPRPERGGRRDEQSASEVRLDDAVRTAARRAPPAPWPARAARIERARGQRAGGHREQLARGSRRAGGQRAEVKRGVEGQALVRPAEEVGHQDQVARGRDRQELRQALDEAEDHRVGVGHPTMSSPPSTPITLPVIQCVSGCERTTMARATSSGGGHAAATGCAGARRSRAWRSRGSSARPAWR